MGLCSRATTRVAPTQSPPIFRIMTGGGRYARYGITVGRGMHGREMTVSLREGIYRGVRVANRVVRPTRGQGSGDALTSAFAGAGNQAWVCGWRAGVAGLPS